MIEIKEVVEEGEVEVVIANLMITIEEETTDLITIDKEMISKEMIMALVVKITDSETIIVTMEAEGMIETRVITLTMIIVTETITKEMITITIITITIITITIITITMITIKGIKDKTNNKKEKD